MSIFFKSCKVNKITVKNMERAFNEMTEMTKNTTFEIINYHYMRVAFDPDTVEQCMEQGHDIIDDFIKDVNSSAKDVKEKFGVDIFARITGNKENIVLIEGAGSLFENAIDAFHSLIRYKEKLVSQINAASTMPVLVKASEISTEKGSPIKPVKANKAAPEPVKNTKTPKTPVVLRGNVVKRGKKNVEKVAKKDEIVSTEKKSGSSGATEKIDFIRNLLAEEGLISIEATVKKMEEMFGTESSLAKRIVEKTAEKLEGIEISDGFLFSN